MSVAVLTSGLRGRISAGNVDDRPNERIYPVFLRKSSSSDGYEPPSGQGFRLASGFKAEIIGNMNES